MFVQDCRPSVAAVIGGAMAPPVEIGSYVGGDELRRWLAVTPAWQRIGCAGLMIFPIAARDGLPFGNVPDDLCDLAGELRALLGEAGPVVLAADEAFMVNGDGRAVVVAVNADGTRAAVEADWWESLNDTTEEGTLDGQPSSVAEA